MNEGIKMKIEKVIDMLWGSHRPLPPDMRTCDQLQFGDLTKECTGIVLTCSPSCDVIRQASALGCNLMIGHEPLFYDGWDDTAWQAGDRVLSAKRRLLMETGMCVVRDHDHMHNDDPDGIFSGLIAELGWESYAQPSKPGSGFLFLLPQTTVGQVAEHVARVMHIPGMRIIGDPDLAVERVAILGHFLGSAWDQQQLRQIDEADVQLIIPGEVIDWTIIAYVRDAISTGRPMAMLNVGHFNLEEPGMRHMTAKIKKLVGESLPVHFIQSGDAFRWLDTGHGLNRKG